MEAAMEFLADTDDKFAHCKTEMLRSEILVERAKARIFLQLEGNNDERKNGAKISSHVTDMEDVYIKWIEEYEGLRAKRQRAELLIDVWRTIEASRRKVT